MLKARNIFPSLVSISSSCRCSSLLSSSSLIGLRKYSILFLLFLGRASYEASALSAKERYVESLRFCRRRAWMSPRLLPISRAEFPLSRFNISQQLIFRSRILSSSDGVKRVIPDPREIKWIRRPKTAYS